MTWPSTRSSWERPSSIVKGFIDSRSLKRSVLSSSAVLTDGISITEARAPQ